MAVHCTQMLKEKIRKKIKNCFHTYIDYLNNFFSFSFLFPLQSSILSSSRCKLRFLSSSTSPTQPPTAQLQPLLPLLAADLACTLLRFIFFFQIGVLVCGLWVWIGLLGFMGQISVWLVADYGWLWLWAAVMCVMDDHC